MTIEWMFNAYSSIKKNLHLNNGVRYLCYHSIIQDKKDTDHTTPHCTAELFYQHLELLKNGGFRVISMEESLALLASSRKYNDRFVSITFDDGYLNNYEVAWPILKQFGYPAHIFVVSSYAEAAAEINAKRTLPYLTPAIIKEFVNEGGSIGSHSATHTHMKNKPAQLYREELAASKQYLERISGKEITTFAYPYSDYDRTLIDCLRETGYRYGFTLEAHLLRSLKRPFHLSRMIIKQHESPRSFTYKINGGYDWTYCYTKTRRFLKIKLNK